MLPRVAPVTLLALGAVSLTCIAGLAGAGMRPQHEWSDTPVRIIALDVREGGGVLRLGVRRSVQRSGTAGSVFLPVFPSNPAGCTNRSTREYNFSAVLNGGTDEETAFVDVELLTLHRSQAKQRELLNEIQGAFITGRTVLFLLASNRCTSTNARVVAGMRAFSDRGP